MDRNSKIFVAGSSGMVGSAIVRCLQTNGYTNIITRSHSDLDLLKQNSVELFFEKERPEYVFFAAAKVGGIAANIEKPADFLYQNLEMESNVIHSSYAYGVKRLLFLASSCIYPRLCPQPMKEEYLLDGKVEPTNEGYALAKIIGIKLCEMFNRQYGTDYISVMPCNIYGIGDNFDLVRSHVIAALMRKIHEAKKQGMPTVSIWGTGRARREFLFVDDLADACLYAMNSFDSTQSFVNIGSGVDVSIKELVQVLQRIIGYTGEFEFDESKPDGMPQKLMDVSLASRLGWKYKTSLEDGLQKTYQWYISQNNFMQTHKA